MSPYLPPSPATAATAGKRSRRDDDDNDNDGVCVVTATLDPEGFDRQATGATAERRRRTQLSITNTSRRCAGAKMFPEHSPTIIITPSRT